MKNMSTLNQREVVPKETGKIQSIMKAVQADLDASDYFTGANITSISAIKTKLKVIDEAKKDSSFALESIFYGPFAELLLENFNTILDIGSKISDEVIQQQFLGQAGYLALLQKDSLMVVEQSKKNPDFALAIISYKPALELLLKGSSEKLVLEGFSNLIEICNAQREGIKQELFRRVGYAYLERNYSPLVVEYCKRNQEFAETIISCKPTLEFLLKCFDRIKTLENRDAQEHVLNNFNMIVAICNAQSKEVKRQLMGQLGCGCLERKNMKLIVEHSRGKPDFALTIITYKPFLSLLIRDFDNIVAIGSALSGKEKQQFLDKALYAYLEKYRVLVMGASMDGSGAERGRSLSQAWQKLEAIVHNQETNKREKREEILEQAMKEPLFALLAASYELSLSLISLTDIETIGSAFSDQRIKQQFFSQVLSGYLKEKKPAIRWITRLIELGAIKQQEEFDECFSSCLRNDMLRLGDLKTLKACGARPKPEDLNYRLSGCLTSSYPFLPDINALIDMGAVPNQEELDKCFSKCFKQGADSTELSNLRLRCLQEQEFGDAKRPPSHDAEAKQNETNPNHRGRSHFFTRISREFVSQSNNLKEKIRGFIR